MLEKPEYNDLKPEHKMRKKFGGRKKGAVNKVTKFKHLLEELESRGFDIYDEWVLAIRAEDYRRADSISKMIPNTIMKPVNKTSSESDLAIAQYKINMDSAQKSLDKALQEQDEQPNGAGEAGSVPPLMAPGRPETVHAEDPKTDLGRLPENEG